MKDSILYFNEIGLKDTAKVGAKNASLGELFQQLTPKGVLVPDGFATTDKVYREFLKQNHLERKLSVLLGRLDVQNLTNLSEIGIDVRTLLSNGVFPYYTQVQILAAYNELVERVEMDCPVAVRCSAITNDLSKVNFAGQLECYLNIKGENALLNACKNCFVSFFTDKAIKYKLGVGLKHQDVALSVGVQQMVYPIEGNARVGLVLNSDEKKTQSHWTALVEDHFKMPMNIEWAKDAVSGKLYIVQASPGRLSP